MSNPYLMKSDPPDNPKPVSEGTDFGTLLGYPLIFFLVVVLVVYLFFRYIRPKNSVILSKISGDPEDVPENAPSDHAKNPIIGFGDAAQPARPRGGLKLGDVNDPPARPGASQKPKNPAPVATPNIPPQPKPTVIESNQPVPTSAPGDFEKALAQAGQRMDALLKQTEELNRTVKLAEKAKMDAQVELNKATTELTRQLSLKDEQIAKLDAQLDRKSTFPSLRALIEVKKLCLDMLNTQKEVSREELVNFVTADIDSKLAALEIQVAEFAVGTPLEKIPGDQVETDRRHEPTDDPNKNNQVARLLRPCYYLERDSKRIIVAKALVLLYRYAAPSPSAESAPSNPAN